MKGKVVVYGEFGFSNKKSQHKQANLNI